MTGCKTDRALNQNGQSQAEKVSKEVHFLQNLGLLDIAAIYCSPLI
jgi:hypothetical protein